jgi:sporulation protein YlmC with PRC-barrel domain
MLEEITQLINLQVYTNHGVYLGVISNVVIDIANSRADGIYIENPNPNLVEESHSVTVPYRWIQCVGDVVILKHFPERVTLTEEERRALGLGTTRAEVVEPLK